MGTTLRLAGVRLLTGVLGTLGALLFAPASAQAECGDYVTIGNSVGHNPTTKQAVLPEPVPPKSRPGNERKPCHGPKCSSAPPAMPVPAAPPDSPRAKDSGLTPAAAGSTDNSLPTRWQDDAGPRPVRLPSTIYHPPR